MNTHDEDRRRYEANRTRLAESERQISYLRGRLEASYEALPRDEALIASIMKETGAPREMVVQRLEAAAEEELTALRESASTPGPSDAEVDDPAVRRFRELLR